MLLLLQAEAVQASMKELQAQAASYAKDAGKLRGGMAAAGTAVEAVRSSRHGLMEAAMLEQVGCMEWLIPDILISMILISITLAMRDRYGGYNQLCYLA
jgi:hypothetical protein